MTRLRCNEQIRLSPIRLIDREGNQRGVVSTDGALAMAREAGMDLVEVSPNERPPVCKIMDYGKHKYLKSKKQKQKHHEQKLKEVRLRPKTDAHDREIKLNRARGFLEHGDRVQFTMMFRGRERFHKEVGLRAFDEIVAMLEDIAKVERSARVLGRRMTMVLVPSKTAPSPKKPKPQTQSASTADRTGAGAEESAAVPAKRAATVALDAVASKAERPVPPPEPAPTGDGPAR